MDIPPDWKPTPANINALPKPLRRYIHELHTVCDPAGDVRELYRLKLENEDLRWECARLAKVAGVGPWWTPQVQPLAYLMGLFL